MKRSFVIFGALALAAALAGPARGQSPYRRGLSRDGWIIGACAAGGVGGALAERSLEPIAPGEIARLSREDVNRFDRGAIGNYSERVSDASYLLAGAVVAAPLALLAFPEVRDDWETYSVMYAETMALAAIIPALAKGALHRFRPLAYNPDAPMDARTAADARASFFSRHAAMAFAAAVFLSSAYDAYRPHARSSPYVWGGSLLAAAAIGIMRVESGEHFPTDVIAGAAVGAAIGYLIPRLHRADRARLALSPACRGTALGIALELRM